MNQDCAEILAELCEKLDVSISKENGIEKGYIEGQEKVLKRIYYETDGLTNPLMFAFAYPNLRGNAHIICCLLNATAKLISPFKWRIEAEYVCSCLTDTERKMMLEADTSLPQ